MAGSRAGSRSFEARSSKRARWSALVAAALLGASALPSPLLRASPAESEAPVALLERLLEIELSGAIRSQETLDLIRSETPEELTRIVPKELELIAALTWKGGAIGVFASDLPPEELRPRFEKLLETQSLRTRPVAHGGFQSRSRRTLEYCNEDRKAKVSLRPLEEERTEVEVHWLEVLRGCPTSHRSQGVRLRLPLLLAPEDVLVSKIGRNSGNDSATTWASLETALPPYTLTTIFSSQLEEQGWTGAGVLDLRGLSFQAFTHQDESGAAWFATLTVSGDESGDRRQGKLQIQRVGDP